MPAFIELHCVYAEGLLSSLSIYNKLSLNLKESFSSEKISSSDVDFLTWIVICQERENGGGGGV